MAMFPKTVINQKYDFITKKTVINQKYETQIMSSRNTNTLLITDYNSVLSSIYKYHINITGRHHNVKSLN